MEVKGQLYPTDYTEQDVLDCVTSYAALTGKKQPAIVIVRPENIQAVQWLNNFDIEIRAGKIQAGIILLA